MTIRKILSLGTSSVILIAAIVFLIYSHSIPYSKGSYMSTTDALFGLEPTGYTSSTDYIELKEDNKCTWGSERATFEVKDGYLYITKQDKTTTKIGKIDAFKIEYIVDEKYDLTTPLTNSMMSYKKLLSLGAIIFAPIGIAIQLGIYFYARKNKNNKKALTDKDLEDKDLE